MSKRSWAFCSLLLLVLLSGLIFAAPEAALPSLPSPVSNNAVAAVKIRGRVILFSFMGMGARKTWDAVSNSAYYYDLDWQKWYPLNPVPGPAGRLGASAIGARETVFLFGGYVVDAKYHGMVVPDVNAFLPTSSHWFRGADMPVAVSDAVIGVYHDRYIYLLGGRSNAGPVADVQVYDAAKDKWAKGTPLPGQPVFGHAGGVLDDTIVYVDGAYKNPSGESPIYLPSDQCWIGKIDHHDPSKIEWSKLPNHPGTARFGIAAGASDRDHKIYFAGGTANPDNYNGLGFDGKPSQPSPVVFAFDLRTSKWESVNEHAPVPTMNTRALLVTEKGIAVPGGLTAGGEETARVPLLLSKSH